MGDRSKSVRDWSSLPSDIVLNLLTCLDDTDMDCLRLRGVCTSWRSSLSIRKSPLQFPLKLDHPDFKYFSSISPYKAKDQCEFLRQSKFYLISPLKECSRASIWLTRVEELKMSTRTSPNVLKLRNPLSSTLYTSKSLPVIKAVINSVGIKFSEVATSYCFPDSIYGIDHKAVMIQFLKFGDAARDFSLLAFGEGNCLYLFKSDEPKWLKIREPDGTHLICDIISFKGRFYAVDLNAKLIVIDPVTSEVKEIIKSANLNERNHDRSQRNLLRHFLVESCGKLYLVHKVVDTTIFYDYDIKRNSPSLQFGQPLEIRVFALGCSRSPYGEANYFWEPVTSIGDRVFFVSKSVTFSVSAQEFGWDKENCIIYTQEEFMESHPYLFDNLYYNGTKNEYSGRISKYCGIYTLEDGKIISADHLPSKYTNIFWPVPSWLDSISTG